VDSAPAGLDDALWLFSSRLLLLLLVLLVLLLLLLVVVMLVFEVDEEVVAVEEDDDGWERECMRECECELGGDRARTRRWLCGGGWM
jgi:hypothetical protein